MVQQHQSKWHNICCQVTQILLYLPHCYNIFFFLKEVLRLKSGSIVIQVYTKPCTCYLVKYQYLLYSYFTGLRMLYIQAIFTLLYFRLDRRTQTEKTDISQTGKYNIYNFTRTLTTIPSYFIHIYPAFLTQKQTTNLSTYSLNSVIHYLPHLSLFSLIIPNGTSSTTTASLRKTRHHSCLVSISCFTIIVLLGYVLILFLLLDDFLSRSCLYTLL